MGQVGKAKRLKDRKDIDGVFHNHGATSKRNRKRHTRRIERVERREARKECREYAG